MLNNLIELLKNESNYYSDNNLLKNKIIQDAMNLDKDLIKLLLKDEKLKEHFFSSFDDVLVFDKVKFQKFVNNKNFLPDSFTAYKNKIGLTINDDFVSDNQNIILAWPYKDCILEGGQDIEDAKREEIFWNETLASDQINRLLSKKVLTNFKKFDSKGEAEVGESDLKDLPNLVIKGNNLLVLHTIKKKYAGKVNLIYIDPPYNPDSKNNTFCYNNRFNRSTWLTYIKNRLDVAKDFLSKDGVLIIAIDSQEQARLGVLLEEMFNEYEIHCITIVHNPRGVQGTNFSYTHEYAFFVIPRNKKSIQNRLIDDKEIDWRNLRDNGGESLRSDAKNCFYGIKVKNNSITGFTDVLQDEINPESSNLKDGDEIIVYPIDREGIERKWRYARQSVESIKHLLRPKNTKNKIEIEIGKDFGSYRTVWQDSRYDANEYGTKLIKSLVPNCKFDFPKSLWNTYDCLYSVIAEDKNAIVMDFFAGSGTTAHAVLELNKKDGGNRKFILAEQMHYVESVTVPRIHQVIKNNSENKFIYCELKMINEEYIQKIILSQNNKELMELLYEIKENAFISYRVDIDVFKDNDKEFIDLTLDEQKKILIEMLNKNMLYLPLTEIDDESFNVLEKDKKLNSIFYTED